MIYLGKPWKSINGIYRETRGYIYIMGWDILKLETEIMLKFHQLRVHQPKTYQKMVSSQIVISL